MIKKGCNPWSRLRQWLVREEWCIAIRPRGDTLLCDAHGTEAPFSVIPNSFRYWCADPFIVSYRECDYLFFEMFDRFQGKGAIGCRIIQNGKVSRMRVIYSEDTHLSFPFVFQRNDDWFMIPESAKSRTIPLLRAVDFPNRWEPAAQWMQGNRYADSVLVTKDGNVFLFSQPLGEGQYRLDLLKLFFREGKDWKEHPTNPIIKDKRYARMAGKIFQSKGILVRPAQDCENEYGEKIHFRRIDQISTTEYIEGEMACLSAQELSFFGKKEKYCGIHTYNFSERYEVVDLKLPSCVRPGYIISILFNLINRMYRVGKKSVANV